MKDHLADLITKTIESIAVKEGARHTGWGAPRSLYDQIELRFTDGSICMIQSRLIRPEGEWWATLNAASLEAASGMKRRSIRKDWDYEL